MHFQKTVTDPYNTELTAQQKSDESVNASMYFDVVLHY